MTATYEVPFGFIDRTFDVSKLDFSQWKGNSMDWPALHWVRKKIDDTSGVAILNKGIPCHRWMPGRFDISLLRSPEWQFCVVEPGNYEFWDIDGQRDAGKHRFEYSIWPHREPLSEIDLTRAGYDYNLPVAIETPFQISGNVVVTAWKPAEAGGGWILRMQNGSDVETTLSVRLDRPMRVCRTNLLELPQEAFSELSIYKTTLHKHGILTICIQNA